MLITKFDPWKSEMCTCPQKYSLNPYTGCSHACIYCYISTYIRDPFHSRPKKDLVKEVEKELRKQKEEITFISLSNSSDPYPPEERKLGMTREVLNVLNDYSIPFHIVTKSDIVVRDYELIGKNVVSMTITEMDSKRIEPGAPATELRVKALKELSAHSIKCTLRLDPVIPWINDSYESIYSIIHSVCDYVEHVTSSTLKMREDSICRLEKIFPRIKWRALYTRRVGRSYYLQEQERLTLMQRVRDACDEHGLTFSCCREGFNINTGKSCDGSHLLGKGKCRDGEKCSDSGGK